MNAKLLLSLTVAVVEKIDGKVFYTIENNELPHV